ncbi:hypothetical protein [Nocardia harenae]|uniref:hypothetical protein n=1 Tax=Nocardia harenae TaxID=358707 RepID=UPI00082ECB08|nr:hypothetical protein [Nocardia harenae]
MVGTHGTSAASLESKLVEHLTRGQGLPGGDVADAARTLIAEAAGSLRPRSTAAVAATDPGGAAARWAREGVALEAVLEACHDGVRAGLELLAAESGPEALPVVEGAELLLRALERVTVLASAAYADEHRAVAREHQTAAQTLVAALLGGHGVHRMARQSGIRVAESYQVIALAIPPHPDEERGFGAASVARRKLRRVQAALAIPFGSRALALLGADGGTVLVPLDADAAMTAATMRAETLAVLSEAAEVPLTAAVTAGATGRIPELAARAHDMLDDIREAGRGPGLYSIPDIADGRACDGPQQARRGVVTSSKAARIGRSA